MRFWFLLFAILIYEVNATSGEVYGNFWRCIQDNAERPRALLRDLNMQSTRGSEVARCFLDRIRLTEEEREDSSSSMDCRMADMAIDWIFGGTEAIDGEMYGNFWRCIQDNSRKPQTLIRNLKRQSEEGSLIANCFLCKYDLAEVDAIGRFQDIDFEAAEVAANYLSSILRQVSEDEPYDSKVGLRALKIARKLIFKPDEENEDDSSVITFPRDRFDRYGAGVDELHYSRGRHGVRSSYEIGDKEPAWKLVRDSISTEIRCKQNFKKSADDFERWLLDYRLRTRQ